MTHFLAILVMFSTLTYGSECEDLNNKRGLNFQVTLEAYNCFEKQNQLESDKLTKSIILNKMAYLKFFQASFYENDSINSLIKSFNLAKDAIKLYGPLFNKEGVKGLPQEEIQQITLGYYLYGTSLSKYVDLKGKWEAIKRMSEIKNTMKMILSLKQPSTFHYGAYRTLAIFNLKVPKIAGGSLARSKMFFEKLFKESMTSLNVVSYPVGHIFYAQYLKKIGKIQEACNELSLVKSLTDDEIDLYFEDLVFETKQDRKVAVKTFKDYSC